jgi:hypothetical protein
MYTKFNIVWRVDLLLNSDSVDGGRCQVTSATYTHATVEERGYATPLPKL